MQLLGVDASNHQGNVDWQAVAASGRAFAIVKASEGITFTDPLFAANWEGLRAAGMVRGCYHFARPSRNSPEAEAAYFLSVLASVGELLPSDMIALDMEDTDVRPATNLVSWAVRWMKRVEQAVGFVPLLYSGAWYMEPHGLYSAPEIVRYPLWLAAYNPTRPEPWGGWERIALWQYSDHELVPGIDGPCDGDQVESAEVLRALGKPETAESTLQTCIDVVHGWGERLGHILSPVEQGQASTELLDVAKMLEGVRSTLA